MKFIKQLFCSHYWKKGQINFNWTPNPLKFGLIWGEGYYEIYHCTKCNKHTTFNYIPLNYIGDINNENHRY